VKRPTNTPKSNPLKTSQASWWTGWTKPLQDLIHTLDADVAGLKARLRNPIHKGRPAAYVGFRDFIPERSVVQVDTAQTGEGTNPCNYVVRDGQEYDIPIIMPGPGVFVAEEITVAIFQQQYAPIAASKGAAPFVLDLVDVNLAAMQAEVRANTFVFPSGLTPYFTTKFSIYPQQTSLAYLGFGGPGVDNVRNRYRVPPQGQRTLNYLWNMVDTKSQRRLADAYISQMVLTPPSAPVTQFNFTQTAFESVPDGDLFRFCTPWVFERDGQVNFIFRPITPVLQFDSSIAGNDPVVGLNYDDRINGVRDQRVRVQVEIHGYRFETDQDLIRAGALTR
jgi:hypothetical protein